MTPKCDNCSAEMRLRRYEHVEVVDGITVRDGTAMLMQCGDHGPELTLDQLSRYEQRAAALVLRSVTSATGAMFRYARKALGLKQGNLGEVLGVAAETVSRWETGKVPVERNVQLAMIALLDTAQHCDVSTLMQQKEPRDLVVLNEVIVRPAPAA